MVPTRPSMDAGPEAVMALEGAKVEAEFHAAATTTSPVYCYPKPAKAPPDPAAMRPSCNAWPGTLMAGCRRGRRLAR
jgi:hypothetical protein